MMSAGLETDVLKGVSRSFYLSLRLLPKPMRRPASIAYLLARTSDTIADSAEVSATARIDCLEHFLEQVKSGRSDDHWSRELIDGTPDPREKILLEKQRELIAALISLPENELALVREVVEIIVSGQRLDIGRCCGASGGKVVSLASREEMEDYTWRVAGCVGVFWTKLGYETLGNKFSQWTQEDLLQHATSYGKGLQLVNILRDLPADLRAGRCYLPVTDPGDEAALMSEFAYWQRIASKRLGEGLEYAGKLRSKRLRIGSALPAMIGKETLSGLEGANLQKLESRIKIPRSKVYQLLLDALLRA